MALSAYIHIPFCTHKCHFCDFAAFAGLDHLEQDYCQVVCKEIKQRDRGSDQIELQSIYYGGGTPGLISVHNLEQIHATLAGEIPIAKNAEITLETTPHAITIQKAKSWLDLGINRLSIGIETLNDNELIAIGRDHTERQALEGIKLACEAGFANISCDLMYGLPTQTIDSFRNTIEKLLAIVKTGLPIKHISAYGLNLAVNSPLYSRYSKDSIAYPNEQVFLAMYQTLIETLESKGFKQYEISNFSIDGFQSKHNLAYWSGDEYLAFGVSAHRYLNRIRSSNWRSIKQYMEDCLGNETSEYINDDIHVREALMLGLRLRKGIDLERFQTDLGLDIKSKFAKQIELFERDGFIELKNGYLSLTQKGVTVSNTIIAQFFTFL